MTCDLGLARRGDGDGEQRGAELLPGSQRVKCRSHPVALFSRDALCAWLRRLIRMFVITGLELADPELVCYLFSVYSSTRGVQIDVEGNEIRVLSLFQAEAISRAPRADRGRKERQSGRERKSN